MSIRFPVGPICQFVATVAVVPTAANAVECKSKNPVLTTACKIVQLVPACLAGVLFLGDIIYKALRPAFYTQADYLERNAFAHFWERTISLSVGALFLVTPIIFGVLQTIAKKHNWTNFSEVLTISEKFFMTAIKVAHIGILTLALMIATLGVFSPVEMVNPLIIPVLLGLVIVNVWATASDLLRTYRDWRQLHVC